MVPNTAVKSPMQTMCGKMFSMHDFLPVFTINGIANNCRKEIFFEYYHIQMMQQCLFILRMFTEIEAFSMRSLKCQKLSQE